MAVLGELTYGVTIKKCDECEYKRGDSLRDDLLVTAGARAAYMDGNCIGLPSGTKGERELSLYIAKLVDYYISIGADKNFDEFIETALIEKYGYKKGE